MNLIIIGPPGSGKGTQAKLLAQKLNLTHVSSGELLRAAASEDSPKGQLLRDIMGRGELVPSETVLGVVADKLKSLNGEFILDGTPRTVAQAEFMDDFFAENKIVLDTVIVYELTDQIAQERMMSRAKLENRADDTPEVIKDRVAIYHKETEPIIEYYDKQGKVLRIDAAPSIEVILEDTLKKLETK